jgi:hypothetical protein
VTECHSPVLAQRAPQRRDGRLAVLLDDDAAARAAGPRLRGAVAAHVDPCAHAWQESLGPTQLRAGGHLRDRLEAPHAQVDRLARRAVAEAGDVRRERVERLGE